MSTKIKPMKSRTHEKLATIIIVGFSYPRKLIPSKILPTKYCDLENMYVYGIEPVCTTVLLWRVGNVGHEQKENLLFRKNVSDYRQPLGPSYDSKQTRSI